MKKLLLSLFAVLSVLGAGTINAAQVRDRMAIPDGSPNGAELTKTVLETDADGNTLSVRYTITNGTWGNNASHLSIFKCSLTPEAIGTYEKIVVEFGETIPTSTGGATYGFIPVGLVSPVNWTKMGGKDKWEYTFTDNDRAKGIDDYSIFFNANGDLKDIEFTITGIYLEGTVSNDYTITTTAGKVGTIALDYPATIEGATLYEVAGFSSTYGLSLAEVEGDMVGGTPYIYLATADEVVCTKTGSSVGHGDFDCTKGEVGNGLVGCYSKVTPSDWWFNYIRSSYVISNGQLRQISQGNITIPANRCFFDPTKCTNNSLADVKMQLGFAEDATAIQNVNAALDGGKIYDLNGREVKTMKKGGIYIMGGMKVSVK